MRKRFQITIDDAVSLIYVFSPGEKKHVIVRIPHSKLDKGMYLYEDELIKFSVLASEQYHVVKRRTVVFTTKSDNRGIQTGDFEKGNYVIEYKFSTYNEFINTKCIKEKYQDVIYKEPEQNLGLHSSNKTKANYCVTNVSKPFKGGKF